MVTGATGFIGTYLVDQLTTVGADVIATGRDKAGADFYRNRGVRFEAVDITQADAFDRLLGENIDAVVHLAALLPANVRADSYDPRQYVTVNTLGTLNVLEFCRRNCVRRMVYSSSHSDVGNLWRFGKPIGDDAPKDFSYIGDHAMYVISKLAGADCVEHYSQEYKIKGIVFRLPPVYGYGPHTEIYVDGKPVKTGFESFVESAMAGKPIELWGDRTNGRDIIYVKDVVSAILAALRCNDAVGWYNIASGKLLSLEEEARAIVKAFSPSGVPSQVVYRPDKMNSIQPFLYDIGKAQRELGWSPKYTFEEMLVDYKKEMGSRRFDHLLRHKVAQASDKEQKRID